MKIQTITKARRVSISIPLQNHLENIRCST